MKLEKILKKEKKCNKIEKNIKEIAIRKEKKFVIYYCIHFIIVLFSLNLITDSPSPEVTIGMLIGSFIVSAVTLLIQSLIVMSLYIKSNSLNLFEYYDSETEKFIEKYYSYLKINKKTNLYYENILYSINESEPSDIINNEEELMKAVKKFSKKEKEILIDRISKKLKEEEKDGVDKEKELINLIKNKKQSNINKKELLMEI
tara:strand:+ start:519 stop:1124 length:606 start_codon:yes stop_codon:yes gene_type:complete